MPNCIWTSSHFWALSYTEKILGDDFYCCYFFGYGKKKLRFLCIFFYKDQDRPLTLFEIQFRNLNSALIKKNSL